MFKPTSKPTAAPQPAAARAAIAVQVTEVEYDTTNPAWVKFDAQMTDELSHLEATFAGLATPLSLNKKFSDTRR